jgi:acetoin utilization protein AcuC
VFNDAGVAIEYAKKKFGLGRILYVDIDAHHCNGVFYAFESDPDVWIADIHEKGIYPGTGQEYETGKDRAEGTKLNIPLLHGSGDEEFKKAFQKVIEFGRKAKPELIIFQCGCDGLAGDPITSLKYTEEAHRFAAQELVKLANEFCEGRLLALGGGGYNLNNIARAWMSVVKELSTS